MGSLVFEPVIVARCNDSHLYFKIDGVMNELVANVDQFQHSISSSITTQKSLWQNSNKISHPMKNLEHANGAGLMNISKISIKYVYFRVGKKHFRLEIGFFHKNLI